MKVRIPLFVLALMTGITTMAQTTTQYLLGAHSCSPWNGSYACDGLPITHMDGSQPSPANNDPAFIFPNLLYNGRLNLVSFLGNDGLGNLPVLTLQDVPAPNSPAGVQQVTVTFANGSMTFLYTKSPRHCSGGRGGGCVTPWMILSGYAEVTQ